MTDLVCAYVQRAVAWAEAKVGSADYPLRCLAFVEDAYELANGIVLDGYSDAGEAAAGYSATPDGEPQRGALVFYECWGTIGERRRNWGHVGIALGDGRVVHSWGNVRVDGYREVESLANAPGWTAARYVGWAPVERVLAGATCRANVPRAGGP